MTLILRANFGLVPMYFSDALLSSAASPEAKVPIVAFEDANSALAQGAELFIVGTVQKLNFLTDRLLIAWAGDTNLARRLCQALLAIADELSTKAIEDLFAQSNFVGLQDELALIGTLVTPVADGSGSIVEHFQFNAHTTYSLCGSDDLEIAVAGSGKRQFGDFVNNWVSTLTKDSSAFERSNQLALQLIGHYFPHELATGGYIDEWWGGAFEVATYRGIGLEKLSNFLFTFWRIVPSGHGHNDLVLVSRFVRHSYFDDALTVQDLQVRCGDASFAPGRLLVHVVLPLLKEKSDYDFSNYPMYEFSHTTLFAFVLPAACYKSKALSLVFHERDRDKRLTISCDQECVKWSIDAGLVIDIEGAIASELGIDAKFLGMSN